MYTTDQPNAYIIFSFTRQANQTALHLQEALQQQYPAAAIDSFTIERLANESQLFAMREGLQKTVAQYFRQENVLIFIGACGIAVRSIAPFIKDKLTDPAVLVVDEQEQFVISLLSGHVGNANVYAKNIAQMIGATPVISTATDLNNLFAVDTFARQNGLTIADRTLAKEYSARLLEGEILPIVYTEQIQLPQELHHKQELQVQTYQQYGQTQENSELVCMITPYTTKKFTHQAKSFARILYLIPKQVVIGIGCKRGTDADKLLVFVREILADYQLSEQSIAAVVSIDLKKEEQAICHVAKYFGCDYETYPAEVLQEVEGTFISSEFVKKVTGTDNVCERSVVRYCGKDTRLCKKIARDGMTIALGLLEVKL